jgi:hypothetical protein
LVAAIGAVLLAASVPKEQPQPIVVEPEPEVVVPVVTIEPVEEPIIVEEEPVVEYSPIREDVPFDDDTQLLLYRVCEEAGVQYELALAVIKQETDFRNITGDSGASVGYMQIQKRWHGERMERLGVTDLSDPYSNFLVGCDYLAELSEKDRGIEWALMAYNGGPSYANKMAKAGKVSQYAESVLNYMNDLGGN